MIELPPVLPGPPVKISASLYAAYLKCPDAARARLDGIYPPENRATLRGGLAHRMFARHLTRGPIPSESFQQVSRQEIGSSSLNYTLSNLRLKPSQLDRIVEEVRSLYGRFRSFPSDGFQDAEVLIEHDAGGGVSLVGRIDACFGVAGRVRLVDWKTGALGDPLPQLRFYALLWNLNRGEPPQAVEAYSVQTGESRQEVPDTELLDDTAARVGGLVDAVRGSRGDDGRLPRTPGPHCAYCPVLDSCEEGSTAMAVLG